MAFQKYAHAEIIGVKTASSKQRIASFDKVAGDWSDHDYKTDDDYLYVRVRAISSRSNLNHDSWPSEELAKSYRTFIGKPLFVEHQNGDPRRTRGVIVDAKLHQDDPKLSSLDPYYSSEDCWDCHKPPTWVELLLEVDAKTYPKFASAIISKEIDGFSMGANVAKSVCSHCGNEAEEPSQFCKHVSSKGAYFDYTDPNTGVKTSRRAVEHCINFGFFELSGVVTPADPTALTVPDTIKHASTKEAFGSPAWFDAAVAAYIPALVAGGAVKGVWDKYRAKYGEQPAPEQEVAERIKSLGVYDGERGGYSTLAPSERMHASKTADRNDPPQYEAETAPDKIDTLRQERACPVCFVPGTLVRTLDGYVPIETVEVGDRVLTSSGHYEKVKEVLENDFNGLLVEINTPITVEPILATPEHPFLTIFGDHPKKTTPCSWTVCSQKSLRTKWQDNHRLAWTCAEHLTTDSYISSCGVEESVDLDRIDVPEQFRGKKRLCDSCHADPNYKRRLKVKTCNHASRPYLRKSPVSFELTEDFLWMTGLYIAEGSTGKRNLDFALNRSETDISDRLQRIFDSYGISTSIRYPKHRKDHQGMHVSVNSSMLAEWFPVWLGSGCANKRIPSELLNLPVEKLKHVVDGIHAGDGIKGNGSIRQTSEVLAMQLIEYGMRIGTSPTTSVERHESKLDVYRVADYGPVATVTKRLPGRIKTNSWPVTGDERFGDKTLNRVRSISRVPYWGKVYNLSVENDNTYVVQNTLVHNCGSDGMTDGQCDVCHYTEPPEGFDNPDLEKAQQVDQEMRQNQGPVEVQEDEQSQQQMQPPAQDPNLVATSSSLTVEGVNDTERSVVANAGGPRGRVRVEELPALPAARKASDKPKDAKVVKDHTRPVESSAEGITNTMSDTQKKQAAEPNGGADVAADARVDVEGVGAAIDTPAEAAETQNVEKDVNVKGPHTDTWSGMDGQTDAVTKSPFPASEDGVKASSTKEAGPKMPDHEPARVDLHADVAEEVGDRTDTWSGTEGQADPVTSDTGDLIDVHKAAAAARKHALACIKLAEAEIGLGLTPEDDKYNRVSELEDATQAEIDAQLATLARVRTAGLRKQVPAKKTAATSLPSLQGRQAAVTPSEHAVPSGDQDISDAQAFM